MESLRQLILAHLEDPKDINFVWGAVVEEVKIQKRQIIDQVYEIIEEIENRTIGSEHVTDEMRDKLGEIDKPFYEDEIVKIH